jgi:hypothetical protein
MRMSPQAERVLDWFHVTMWLTVMRQLALDLTNAARAVQPGCDRDADDEAFTGSELLRDLESRKWAFVESAVNQIVSRRFVKKQQMRWTERGGRHLLQVRTRVLNGDWRKNLERWNPGMEAVV